LAILRRRVKSAAYLSRRKRKFLCVACGFSAHADWVGAVNIREAGLASLALLVIFR
jgi:transposase